jgi:hypothetical protein
MSLPCHTHFFLLHKEASFAKLIKFQMISAEKKRIRDEGKGHVISSTISSINFITAK